MTKSINDKITNKITRKIKKEFKNYEDETNPTTRANIFNDIFPKMYYEWVLEIDKLSDEDFEKFANERYLEFDKFKKNLMDTIFKNKMDLRTLDFKDIGLFVIEPSLEQSDNVEGAKEVDRILKKKKTLERLYRIELLSRFGIQMELFALLHSLSFLKEIEGIVKRRFNFDYNWILAMSILSIHENIVKKKLEELGVTEDEIQKILKKSQFQGLVKHLGKLIEKKEKRKLSLSFYKSPSIRTIRNKMEHEGYKQNVNKDDVVDLLNEIKKFEKELFPETKK